MRLTWSLTWEDRPNDYKAVDPETGQPVGRIYYRNNGADGSQGWAWFGSGQIGVRLFTPTGDKPTKQEAADALTEAWVAFKERMKLVSAA